MEATHQRRLAAHQARPPFSHSPSAKFGGPFWDRLWRMSGLISVALFVIAYFIYDYLPQDGGRARVLFAAVFSGNAVLFLLWFAAALRTTLADAGQEGWGAAATASSAAVGALFLLLTAVGAVLAYSVAGSGNDTLTSGLNDVAWALVVLTSFPRAMLIMSGTFGLWRAGLVSNALFAAGVAVVVLTALGGATWLSGGIWAPDGVYSRLVSPIIGLVWVVVVNRVLLTRRPATRSGW